MKTIIKEETEDGSSTLYVPELDEHYHSTKGALTESKYIFIEQGLLHRAKTNLKVLEIGFGTGLNTLETLLAILEHDINVEYHSLELFPLAWKDVENLGYSHQEYHKLIIDAPWDKASTIVPGFELIKHFCDFTKLQEFTDFKNFDVVYFDAFAPEKQPEMWSQQLFDALYVLLNKGGVLTTYCAKGVIRRMLQASGFQVERLPGPPNGKREILRASKL